MKHLAHMAPHQFVFSIINYIQAAGATKCINIILIPTCLRASTRMKYWFNVDILNVLSLTNTTIRSNSSILSP